VTDSSTTGFSGLTTIEADLAAAAERRAEHRDLQQRRAGAGGYLHSVEQRVAELRTKLGTEEQDVERLESFSPTRIWAGLKGSHLVDLDRERAERDAARYAVAEAEARREAAHRDVESIEAQIAALGDVEGDYARALAAKEEWALAHDAGVAAALADIAEQRGELLARDREAAEAQSAGHEALTLLGQALSLLGSAESYSTWDTFLGGGMLSDMAKYNKMDQATAALHRADVALARFSRELADVGHGAVGSVAVDGLTRTFDVFFDNIFSDMAVRSRIQDAARRADQTAAAVHEALARLDATRMDVARQLEELRVRRDGLLTGSSDGAPA
jgi:hypothetical protein